MDMKDTDFPLLLYTYFGGQIRFPLTSNANSTIKANMQI